MTEEPTMVMAKVVDIKDLLNPEENPALCLSPLRVFNECHKCPVIKRYLKAGKSIEEMKCKPHLKPEALELLEKRRKLSELLSKVDELLQKL